jgi:hypothetical protein
MNRYKINKDGAYEFYPFNQKFNKEIWLEDDGRFELDVDGNYYKYYNQDGTPDTAKIQAEIDATQVVLDKEAKLLALSEITVTTANGNTFDGDDVARQDMMSAIQAGETLGLTTTKWKLADNTWKDIGLAEMKEASALAIVAKGTILNG